MDFSFGSIDFVLIFTGSSEKTSEVQMLFLLYLVLWMDSLTEHPFDIFVGITDSLIFYS